MKDEVDQDTELLSLISGGRPTTLDLEALGRLSPESKENLRRIFSEDSSAVLDEWGRVFPHWYDSRGRYIGPRGKF